MLPLSGKKKGAPLQTQKAALSQKSPAFALPGNKVHFVSLGCPRNLVDSEVMLGILLKAGYEATPDLPTADFIIINTCGFLQASRDESTEATRQALAERKKGAKVIVTGCMVQTHSDVLKEALPHIDYLLGSGDVEGILRAVQSQEGGEQISEAKSYLQVGEVPRYLSTPRHFAYLKIAEGCKKRCAYCIIPTIKGPLKSKSEDQVVKEFTLLLEQGVHEVILIAQDLGDYAKDRGEKRLSGLLKLLERLLEIQRPFWLRLLYLYPDEITDELIALMKRDPRICPYLDMPIQHIDDTMLRSMHRATSQADIVRTLTTLRREIPHISVRTSLIVGFPGETIEQFERLKTFIQEHPLDQVGIFKFSREEGSAAYHLPNQIAEEVKEARWHELMAIQQKTLAHYNRRWIGKTVDVIVEGYHPETKLLMRGRHQGQCPDIDGQVLINDPRGIDGFGKIYKIAITDVAGYDLVGKLAR